MRTVVVTPRPLVAFGQDILQCSAVDRASVAQDWLGRGFSCDLWVDPPGQVWENYVHSVDELVMLLEGELELKVQGRVFQPKIGEEVFIPAHGTHSVRNIGGTTAKWLYGYKGRGTGVMGYGEERAG